MHISWHGQYTVRIVTKDITLVIDPYSPEAGLPPFRSKADIVSLSNPTDKAMSHVAGIQGEPVIVDTPGEYSLKNMTLYAYPWVDTNGVERALQRWEIEGMSVLYLGSINRDLSDNELAHIERTDIDILLVPVGGGSALGSGKALGVVSTIEPRVVIPIHFAVPGLKEKLDSIDTFAKEMGVNPKNREKKVIIKPNSLPHEDVQTILLKP